MQAEVFDTVRCALGEGPLWHPKRQELFWFDILGRRLLSKAKVWGFDRHVSAAGWVDHDTLLIASETDLFALDLTTDEQSHVINLEHDNPVTRSNDGRADPWGGFWIGTMGKEAEPGAGAIYRFYQGKLEPLFDGITISNAICFAPDKSHACFTDTVTQKVMRQLLDEQGWPQGNPEVYLDLRHDRLNPDGAVIDAKGNLWLAQWGASRVACYDPNGALIETVETAARQASCPAFGGADLSTLYITSAAVDLDGSADGLTYHCATAHQGQAEHQVII